VEWSFGIKLYNEGGLFRAGGHSLGRRFVRDFGRSFSFSLSFYVSFLSHCTPIALTIIECQRLFFSIPLDLVSSSLSCPVEDNCMHTGSYSFLRCEKTINKVCCVRWSILFLFLLFFFFLSFFLLLFFLLLFSLFSPFFFLCSL
jgi:hypothetical protein